MPSRRAKFGFARNALRQPPRWHKTGGIVPHQVSIVQRGPAHDGAVLTGVAMIPTPGWRLVVPAALIKTAIALARGDGVRLLDQGGPDQMGDFGVANNYRPLSGRASHQR